MYSIKYRGKKRLNQAMVSSTVEYSLLKVGTDCFHKVTETLKNDYNATIEDCYDNPEYLVRVLNSLYGNDAKAITSHIKESLEEYEDEEEISEFLNVICK